jgi:hypothetical protein
VRIHQVGPHEHDLHEALGALTIGAYLPVHPEFVEDGYAEVLADIAGRVANAVVLAALSDEGDELLGGVTYVPDRSSPLASFDAAAQLAGRSLVNVTTTTPTQAASSRPGRRVRHRLSQRRGHGHARHDRKAGLSVL